MNGNEEAFTVYHEGVALQLKWAVLPALKRAPAVRLCAVSKELLLLLTADECLYTARLDAANAVLYLQLQRTQVRDVGYCRQTRQLFIVSSMGAVLLQQLSDKSDGYAAQGWETLSFDPLELSEEGIRIERVCCSAQGVLFVTRSGELYAMGSCGEVFNAEAQPKKVRLYEERLELLDLAAGDDFFVVLLRCNYAEHEDPLELLGSKAGASQASSSGCTLAPPPTTPQLAAKRCHTQEFDCTNSEDAEQKHELNSNSSVRSYSTKSSSHAQAEQDFAALLLHGYALLHTQVRTFGAANNGLLGTGDHMRRSSLQLLQKLDAVGVCSISAGREHSVARTLDGRLYHWGLNSRHQLNGQTALSDLSAPTELLLDRSDWDTRQRSVLAACCGDYQTVLLNARAELHSQQKQLSNSLQQDMLTLHMASSAGGGQAHSLPLLLAADAYTLHNHRHFQQQHHACWFNLQLQLRLLLKQRQAVQLLQLQQQRFGAAAPLKQLQPLCQYFHKLLCLLAALLHSLECYYRGDYDSPAELLFVQQHRECIAFFEQYTRAYCDIYSIDGFAEAAKLQAHSAATPEQREDTDWTRIFQQPFQIFPNFVQFLQQLAKTRHEYMEHLLAWQALARQNRIDLELAESTQDFWQRNERNNKIRHFRRKHRRVILTSSAVPLKLANHVSMTTSTYILFSDCLCQLSGSQLLTYPLTVLWLKHESDTCLHVTTPERKFTLAARTHDDKKLWYDQLESSIMAALCRPEGSKMSQVRTTTYQYSRSHAKYANVHAYGRWRNGLLHGNCYLEYPDGRYYFGQVRQGEIEGYGKMVIPTVGLYEGTFLAGKFHGHGTYELKDNEVYEGNFRDGLFHGHGILRGNNYTYVGEYQGNAKCGYGVLDDMQSGDKYMGMFADNKRAGPGICITMNGDYFEGMYANDELAGTGIAVFENDYYYEGELSQWGPTGKGTYYMPNGLADAEDSGVLDDDEFPSRQLLGNVLSGQLAGNWHDVRVISGTVAINRQFSKYPSSIGALVVDNNRKWLSLFENFEDQLLGLTALSGKKSAGSSLHGSPTLGVTKQLWSRIAVFMTTQREREKTLEQQDTACQSTRSYFAKNISLGFTSASYDKLSLKSTTSLLQNSGSPKASLLELNGLQHAHSQETLTYNGELHELDLIQFPHYHSEENSFNSSLNAQLGNWANDSTAPSLRSSVDSALNLSGSFNNNNSFSSQNGLEFVPSFGINSLTEGDVSAIKEYLIQAFKDRHHPLHLLNQRIANCFYTSYGCWKVKPTPILAKQAMREWESISKRVYKFVRKMFPALPEDFCVLESTREVISHITLLYPIVLSEGIYSTLFVLYANKHSGKDEMYRQNLMYADKLEDEALAASLSLESSLLPVVRNTLFLAAIQTLKQLQEKYSPKAMLTVIENCMQQITDAHKTVESENSVLIGADSIMPLTLFLVLRAAVPHLGAELALLDDLTGGANFQFEMNGMAGYCYTTLKAAYEHITAKSLNKT